MKKFIYSLGLAVFAVFLIAGLVQAASTIGTNISTAGTLSVTGATTMTAGLTVDTNTLKVDVTNNRVGIGTTTPYSILSVTTAAQAIPATRLLNVASTTGIALFTVLGSGNTSIGTNGVGSDFTLYTDTAGEELLWDASANKLTIDGADGANALEVTDGNVAFTDSLTVTADLTVDTNSLRVDSTNNYVGVGTTTPKSYLSVTTAAQAAATSRLFNVASTTGVALFTVRANGMVGVGDNTPDTILDILSSSAANTQITITNTNAGSYDAQVGFQLAEGTNLFTMGVDDSDSDKFKISTTGLGTADRFVIDGSGNVGVGSSTPMELFSVGTGVSTTLDLGKLCIQGNSTDGTRYHVSFRNGGTFGVAAGNCP